MEVQEKPHKPAYESRTIIRNLDGLDVGKAFIQMYDPRTNHLIHVNGFWSNLPMKSKPIEKLILLEILDDQKKALFFTHSTLEQKEMSLADLGVMPYENGRWDSHNYLVRAESSQNINSLL